MNPNNGCTCYQSWSSVVPPPPCPVHSKSQCCCHCGCKQAPPTTTAYSITVNNVDDALDALKKRR